MTRTPLDAAWEAAEAEGADGSARARFWDLFAASELFLMIDPETLAGDEAPRPAIFPVEGVETALVFDTEARLAEFAEDGAAHLTLSGRAAIGMFAGTGAQLGLNLGDAPSATILPAAALDWAAKALRQPIEEAQADGMRLSPPASASESVLAALDAKLNALGPALAEAWLCEGEGGLILCLGLRTLNAEGAVVSALAETARFAGGDAPAFDIAAFAANDPRLAAARAVGLGFAPENPEETTRREIIAPGSDKSKPPRLR